jgi:hypothetical protein
VENISGTPLHKTVGGQILAPTAKEGITTPPAVQR